ncbi:beta-galactosidase [Promethearchaeum syntrophicum]|uniref:Beta-galactosidase n=1 Tax=Promethearchaeum syntrophicum TaxID=2594042 RepID=A0A5B9D869_9ARCH|nr:beta-galactosidase [Candidatus Prometheoarchaeum syntrophicum]QEE15225.1 Glycosyl hydrolases family 35 [Candidatus Prometheoarchaeum syntrophicum]
MDDNLEVKLNSNSILIGENPVFLFSSEFHYYIIPQEKWNEEIKNLKKIGFNAITIYIPWNFHEKIEGEFDFKSSNCNLKKLFHLCAKNNILIYIKSGPRSSQAIQNSGYPLWLFENYNEILDSPFPGKKTSEKNQKDLNNQKTPIISILHPKYLEKVHNWYKKIFSLIENYQYPKGNIILIQFEDDLLYNFDEMYFSFGYSQFNQKLYRKWLKNKYLLIPIFNEIYLSDYKDFEDILPPSPPLNLKHPIKEIIPYIEWLEFKESILNQYIGELFDFFNEFNINLPLILNLWSYKSPISVNSLKHSISLKQNRNPFTISLNFYPIVFKSQVNVNCYINWHSEWLKSQSSGPTFISKIQECIFGQKFVCKNTQNILRLSLAHGIKALSFVQPQLPEQIQFQSSKRFREIQNFKQFIDLHLKSLIESKKVYDPLTLAYYHPVTRLKSFTPPINSQSFSFPINYEHLKYSYKNLMQLFTKTFLQYDVIDLQNITNEELDRKPFLILYFLGWLEHKIMIKLLKYVENGGTLITFGDIPSLNENLEFDDLISNLYGAKCLQEIQDYEGCTLIFEESTELFNDIENIFEYEITKLKDVHILAHKGKSRHILAFSRKVNGGKIIHCGIMPKKEISSLKLLNLLLEEADFPIQNISATNECVAIQNATSIDERFITVGNLKSAPIKSVSFTFYNPLSQIFPKNLVINEITLPPNTFSTWHAFKQISEDVIIHYCTGEIYAIINKNDEHTISIRFLAHPSFPNDFTGKISIWMSKNASKIEIEKGTIKISEEKSVRNYKEFKEFTILSNCESSFSFQIEKENFTFKIQKYFVPGDEK